MLSIALLTSSRIPTPYRGCVIPLALCKSVWHRRVELHHFLLVQSQTRFCYATPVYVAPFRPPRHAGTLSTLLGTLREKGGKRGGQFFRPEATVGVGLSHSVPQKPKGGDTMPAWLTYYSIKALLFNYFPVFGTKTGVS